MCSQKARRTFDASFHERTLVRNRYVEHNVEDIFQNFLSMDMEIEVENEQPVASDTDLKEQVRVEAK